MTEPAVSLALVGDIYVARDEPERMFEHVASELQESDLLIGNQEVGLSDRGARHPMVQTQMKSSPPMVAALTAGGFHAVSLANNHTMDYGHESLLQTIEVLDGAGILHAGGGQDEISARKAAVLRRGGRSIGLLSYASVYWPGFEATGHRGGIATVAVEATYRFPARAVAMPGMPIIPSTRPVPEDVERMRSDVSRAKQEAAIVIVAYHWGVSAGYGKLADYQRELARATIEAGADMVVGHHPHFLQPIEFYKGKPIAYSLGNFGFEMRGSNFGTETAIFRCRVDGRGVTDLSLLPCVLDETCRPRIASAEEAGYIHFSMRRMCQEFGTRLEFDGRQIRVSQSVARA